MDFHHGWKNSTGNLSPLFGSGFPYAPSPYRESLYNFRSAPNSLVNLPCCNSPAYSNLPKFSPEPYSTSHINQNIRFHPYQPHYGPFMGIDNTIRDKTHNLYSGNNPDCVIINEKRFDSLANSYQKAKMHQNLCKGKCDDKTNFKPKPKRKKQTNLRNSFPAQHIYNNPQINYDPTLLLNPLPNKEDFVNIKQEKYSEVPMLNESNYAIGKKYSREEVMEANIDNTTFSMHNSNDSEEMNLVTRADKLATVNSGCQNAQVMNNFTNEHESTNTIFGDAVTSAVVNHSKSKNIADFPNRQLTPITMTENSIFNVRDIQQETVPGEKFTREEVMKGNTDNTTFPIYDSNDSEKKNSMALAAQHASVNSGCQNTPVINNFSNEHERTDLFFGEAVTNVVVNNFESKSIPDLSNCQVTHITMPENSIFNVQDIQQENLENTDLANYFFKPIFEGKDENGEDIVILLSNPNTQSVDMVNVTNTSGNNQCLEARDNQATLTYLTESTSLTSEISSESQVQEVKNEIDETTLFSHLDDYGAQETVTTSKKKNLRAKKTSNKNSESSNENHLTNANQTTAGNSTTNNFTSQPSRSRENKSTSNGKSKHFPFSQHMPRLRRRLLWKRNEPVINMQRDYFRRFMKRVKYENEQMLVSEDFWNMYRTIVTRIGGNLLQTMYNILPTLIRISGESRQRSNEAASKQNKNHLKVKFPPKMKKQNNSGN